jgi:hypothetical protein
MLDDFGREAVAGITDFGHSGRLRARARTQQGAGRDNAIKCVLYTGQGESNFSSARRHKPSDLSR